MVWCFLIHGETEHNGSGLCGRANCHLGEKESFEKFIQEEARVKSNVLPPSSCLSDLSSLAVLCLLFLTISQ